MPSRFHGAGAHSAMTAPAARHDAQTAERRNAGQCRTVCRSTNAGPNIAARCEMTMACGATASARHQTTISGKLAIIGNMARPANSAGHWVVSRHAPAGHAGSEQSNRPARQRRPFDRWPSPGCSVKRTMVASVTSRPRRNANACRSPRSASATPAHNAPRLAAPIGGAGATGCTCRRLRTTP